MKRIKLILLVFFGLWVTYVVNLYVSSFMITYLIPQGYEGPLFIVANQKDGIEVVAKHAIYDFTKGNLIRLKGNLLTGFFPWGYLNYYSVDSRGNKEVLETLDNPPEKLDVESNRIYLWSGFHKVGSYELKDGSKISYESIIVSKKSNVNKYLNQENAILHDIIK